MYHSLANKTPKKLIPGILQHLPVMLGIIIILIFFTIYIAFIYHNNFKRIVIAQWNQQLTITINILSVNLESFLEKYSENLVNLAHNPVIQRRACGKPTQEDMNYCPLENLYKIHKSEMDAIILTDKEGKIIRRFPTMKLPDDTEQYCPRGIAEEKKLKPYQVNISGIFNNKKGNPSISISVPVYYNDEFSGAVRWMVSINTISNKFINPIKVGRNGYMWVVDNEGLILAHHEKKFVGIRIRELLSNPAAYGLPEKTGFSSYTSTKHESFYNLIFSGKSGTGRYVDFAHMETCLAAYQNMKIGKNSWILIMSLPYSEIVDPIRSHALKTFILAAIISSIIILMVINFYKVQKTRNKLEIESKYLSELARSEEALRKERSKRLTAVIDGQEMERSRISRELHDGLGQLLLAIKVKLEQLSQTREKGISEKREELNELLVTTLDEVKRISDNLMPVSLDDLGLSNAIQSLCSDVSRTNRIEIDFVSHGISENIESKIKTYLYRITQEALSNVIKHSEATEVNVQLLGNDKQLTLIIQDNGKGFIYDPVHRLKGNGINNIRERVAILNGIVDIVSSTEMGTVITVKINLSEENDQSFTG